METEAQRKVLQELECDLVQGFLISRPLPPSSVTDYLNERARWPASRRLASFR
ncbi:MAG TPA: hypothetical protein VF986_05040 [Actinomycetota bacterium]